MRIVLRQMRILLVTGRQCTRNSSTKQELSCGPSCSQAKKEQEATLNQNSNQVGECAPAAIARIKRTVDNAKPSRTAPCGNKRFRSRLSCGPSNDTGEEGCRKLSMKRNWCSKMVPPMNRRSVESEPNPWTMAENTQTLVTPIATAAACAHLKSFDQLRNRSFRIGGENSLLQKKPAAGKKPVVRRVFVATATSDRQSRLQRRCDDRGLHNLARKQANKQGGECEGGGRRLSAASAAEDINFRVPLRFNVNIRVSPCFDLHLVGVLLWAEPRRSARGGGPAPAPCLLRERTAQHSRVIDVIWGVSFLAREWTANASIGGNVSTTDEEVE